MHWDVIKRRQIPWVELQALEFEAHRKVVENKISKILIVAEPLATYTHGTQTDSQGFTETKERLEGAGVKVSAAARGGQWTYHGPGQLLLFPIFHLPSHGFQRLGIKHFMNHFRRIVQQGLSQFGVATLCGEKPFGLFRDNAKIVSFGMSFKNEISGHGMALYVTPQHEKFQAIHPCGVVNGKTTSVSERVPLVTWEDLAENMTQSVKIGLISG